MKYFKQIIYTLIAIIILVSISFGVYNFLKQRKTTSQPSNNNQNIPAEKPYVDIINNGEPLPSDTIMPGDKLNLSNKDLEKVPTNIFTQINLEELNLSNNKLTGAIPAEIRKLKNLKVLNLSNNQMTGLPAEIGQLLNLEILDISNNQLTGLPYELGNLQKLLKINISGNNYSEIDLKIILEKLPKDIVVIK